MKPPVDLRFRPTLVIFLDETGARICEQLQSIVRFTGFDPILCQSVALLNVNSQSMLATPVALNGTFADKSVPQEEDRLGVLIDRTLRDVQNNRRIQAIIAAGYPIPNTRTQIFIVGDAHSSEMPRVLDLVRQRLRRSGFATLVCYFANAYHMRQITAPLENEPSILDDEAAGETIYTTGSYWSDRHAPDFCYLYEDMRTYPTESFFDDHVSYYTTAEAIFALLATGISTEPVFVQQMQTNTPFHTYENVGSLSTCLIGFPRTQLLEYCSARLGVALMEQWRTELLQQNTPVRELEKLQKNAIQRAQILRRSVSDSLGRPYAYNPQQYRRQQEETFRIEEPLWPSLDVLQREKSAPDNPAATAAEQKGMAHGQQRARRNLYEATRDLFLLFWPDDIDEVIQRQKSRDWVRLILQRSNRAATAYNEWDKRATHTWDLAANQISAEIREAIDYLWSKDQNGFEMATTYVDELDDQLAKLADEQSHWREEHQERYLSFLATWEGLATGPWVIPDDEGGSGAGQARPTMQNQHANGPDLTSASNPPPQETIIGNASAPATTEFQHLPEHEERIVRWLEQRINWHQARIPTWTSQMVFAFPFILGLALAILSWLPARIFAFTPPLALTTTVVFVLITLFVALIHIAFHIRYTRNVKMCKEDLLIFYRQYYVYQCEKREDKLRVIRVLSPLRRTVQRIRERLDNIQMFIEQTRDRLEVQASKIEDELFNSSASFRDIFVANGERLQRRQKNTLEDFAGQISKLRVKDPVEDWHQSSATLKRQLIQQFRQQSLMEMSDEAAQKQILAFVTGVSQTYFKGSLIDVRNALDKEDIWLEAIDRVETPLYQIQVGNKGLQFLFACGRVQDMANGWRYMRSDTYPVKISDTHEWVLLVAFFRGGLPTTINPEILFPVKTSTTSADASMHPPDLEQGTNGSGFASTIDDRLPFA